MASISLAQKYVALLGGAVRLSWAALADLGWARTHIAACTSLGWEWASPGWSQLEWFISASHNHSFYHGLAQLCSHVETGDPREWMGACQTSGALGWHWQTATCTTFSCPQQVTKPAGGEEAPGKSHHKKARIHKALKNWGSFTINLSHSLWSNKSSF